MYPNNTQQQNTLTVVTTATIQLNLDGTWNVIAFESDDKRQTKIHFPEFNKLPKQHKLNNNHGLFSSRTDFEDDKPAIVTDWDQQEQAKTRKVRAKETKQRKPRIRSHCKKCGMKGKNILTCLSTVDRKGNARSQHHRI